MSEIGRRPNGLIAIVSYKALNASLFAIAAITIFLASKNYEDLQNFAESVALSGKKGIIAWVLEKILNFNPRTLQFSAVGLVVYAVVTVIEAIGLWYEKAWARWLVIGVVGISIPPEIFELTKGISILKLIIFILNLVIFWYLLQEFPEQKPEVKSED